MMDVSAPYLAFMIENGLYAINIGSVKEILDLRPLNRLPNAPKHLLGMIDLRGDAVPITDMRTMMGYADGVDDQDTRLVVVEIANHLIGLRCDKVREVIMLDGGSFAPILFEDIIDWTDRATLGTARHNGDFVTLLDVSALLHGQISQAKCFEYCDG